jgi:hypothetical protein
MLGALVFIYENAPTGDLPTNNGTLFQSLARALWERERQRGTHKLPFEQAEAAFARLAFSIIEEDRPVDVPLAYTIEKLGDENWLQLGERANYVRVNGDHMRFYHQLMLEYFAAIEVNRIGIISKVGALAQSGTIRRRVATKWDEVMVAACGLGDDPAATLRRIFELDRELAVYCLLGLDATQEVRQEIIKSLLVDLLDQENGMRRFVAARTLIRLPDPISIPALTQALHDQFGDPKYDVVSDYAKDALRTIGTPEALDAVQNAPRW